MEEMPLEEGQGGDSDLGQKQASDLESWRMSCFSRGHGQLQATELGLHSRANHPQEGRGGTHFFSLSALPLRLGLSERPRVLWIP